jgi:hypothetical protein
MPEFTDFFQKEAQECRRLAGQATKKNDQEYWLRLADRWEWLLQQNGKAAEIKTVQPLRPGSVVLKKRFAKPKAA